MRSLTVLSTILCVLFAGCKGSSSLSSPSPSNSPTFDVAYNGMKLTFSVTSPTTATSYEWDFGDGSPHDFTRNPTHFYSVEGFYTVQLTVDGSLISKKSTGAFPVTWNRPVSPTPSKPGQRGGYCSPKFNNSVKIDVSYSITPPGNVEMYFCKYVLSDSNALICIPEGLTKYNQASTAVASWDAAPRGESWCTQIVNIGPDTINYEGHVRFTCLYDC